MQVGWFLVALAEQIACGAFLLRAFVRIVSSSSKSPKLGAQNEIKINTLMPGAMSPSMSLGIFTFLTVKWSLPRSGAHIYVRFRREVLEAL